MNLQLEKILSEKTNNFFVQKRIDNDVYYGGFQLIYESAKNKNFNIVDELMVTFSVILAAFFNTSFEETTQIIKEYGIYDFLEASESILLDVREAKIFLEDYKNYKETRLRVDYSAGAGIDRLLSKLNEVMSASPDELEKLQKEIVSKLDDIDKKFDQ